MAMMRKSGVQIIELTIVIVLLAATVALLLPKLLDLRGKSSVAQEDAVWAAVGEAITTRLLENRFAGTPAWQDTETGESDYWPAENPFELVKNSPPYQELSSEEWDAWTPATQRGDGVNWICYNDTTKTTWYIFCPHYQGSKNGSEVINGRRYVYVYGPRNASQGEGGTIKLLNDGGHND